MKYPIAPLFVRPWTLNGISPGLIESHYEINYGGTVNRLNAIVEQLDSLDPATTPPEVIYRLKRDEFTALNSMLLHELYFSSIGGDGRAVTAEMTAALTRDFGSVNRWRDEFIGLSGSLAATGCAGWVLLTFVPRDGRLINHFAIGSTATASPAASRSWPSTCTSMPITSTSGQTQRPISPPSCAISTGIRPSSARYDDASKVAAPPNPCTSSSSLTCRGQRRGGRRRCWTPARPSRSSMLAPTTLYRPGAGHHGRRGLARSRAHG